MVVLNEVQASKLVAGYEMELNEAELDEMEADDVMIDEQLGATEELDEFADVDAMNELVEQIEDEFYEVVKVEEHEMNVDVQDEVFGDVQDEMDEVDQRYDYH